MPIEYSEPTLGILLLITVETVPPSRRRFSVVADSSMIVQRLTWQPLPGAALQQWETGARGSERSFARQRLSKESTSLQHGSHGSLQSAYFVVVSG